MIENQENKPASKTVNIKGSKAGIVGDSAHVEGGIDISEIKNSIVIENFTVYHSYTTDNKTDSPKTETEPDSESPAKNIGPNPYMGLGAFQEKDADRFFGREELTKKLWEKFPARIFQGACGSINSWHCTGTGNCSQRRDHPCHDRGRTSQCHFKTC